MTLFPNLPSEDELDRETLCTVLVADDKFTNHEARVIHMGAIPLSEAIEEATQLIKEQGFEVQTHPEQDDAIISIHNADNTYLIEIIPVLPFESFSLFDVVAGIENMQSMNE